MKIYIIRGWNVAFHRKSDAIETIAATWGNPALFEIKGKDNTFVIRHVQGGAYTAVHIDEIDVLERSTHL